MRISDWSSDVCSSDLYDPEPAIVAAPATAETQPAAQPWITPAYAPREQVDAPRTTPAFAAAPSGSMGRHEATALAGPTPDPPFAPLSTRIKSARLDRKSVVSGKSLSVRLTPGGRRNIKKQKNKKVKYQ